MKDDMNTIFDSVLVVERCDNVDSLKVAVREAVQRHGYDRIMVFSTSLSSDELLGGIYWIEGEWFDDGEALDAETYVRHCPVTHHILETDHPFFWTNTSLR